MLAHRIPFPPHTGDKVRAFHVARGLARRHDVTLAFPIDEAGDVEGVEALREAVGAEVAYARLRRPWALARGALGLACGQPLTLGYFGSDRLRRRIDERLDVGVDVVYVSSSAMAQYVPAGRRPPTVMDFVDVDSDKWTQYARRSRPPLAWLYRLEGRRLAGYEAGVSRWADLCLLATPAEEALLRTFAPWARTRVVPNGVEVDRWRPLAEEAVPPTVLFAGAMDYRPNIDAVAHFCTDILPLIQRDVPATRFLIVGLNPARRVQRLAARPGVVVTGAVPDVAPYYARATVCVAPLRLARGVQNKVLQAMAFGRPVVATRAACQGLAVVPGEHLYVEDDPVAFAARVVGLLRDRDARVRLAGRARRFVEAEYAWDPILGRLTELVEAVAAGQMAVDSRDPDRPRARSGAGMEM